MTSLVEIGRAQGSTHLSDRVRYLRVSRGWSQRELASRANLSASTISRIESGARPITNVSVLTSVFLALDCKQDGLVSTPSALRASRGIDRLTEAIRQAFMATTLTEPPHQRSNSLPYAGHQAALAHQQRKDCDYRAAASMIPDALLSLHAHLHGEERVVAVPLLVRLCFDATVVLNGLGEVATAWTAAHRCRDATALAEGIGLTAVAHLAVAMVALREGADCRVLEITRAAQRRPRLSTAGAAMSLLHLATAEAGARSGLLSAALVEHHLGSASVLAGLAASDADPLGLSAHPRLTAQTRFRIAIHGNKADAAKRMLLECKDHLPSDRLQRALLHLDLGIYHLQQGDYREALTDLVGAEKAAAQYVYRSPDATRLLAQLAVVVRSDSLRRTVGDVWRRLEAYNSNAVRKCH
ncbi:helix-turn-helix domain-containing protein [Micromonospora sp. LOL_025]|uniref:helix-turn-helix domain-containing protein n=1 Tax=Micromonospora sp. LOL_025 TaxID=3345413 RepID=UPI003A8C0DB8